jgi:hypothetical protein
MSQTEIAKTEGICRESVNSSRQPQFVLQPGVIDFVIEESGRPPQSRSSGLFGRNHQCINGKAWCRPNRDISRAFVRAEAKIWRKNGQDTPVLKMY